MCLVFELGYSTHEVYCWLFFFGVDIHKLVLGSFVVVEKCFGILIFIEVQLIWGVEETLMLGKVEGRRRRGQQRTRWLFRIIDSMDMSLNKL